MTGIDKLMNDLIEDVILQDLANSVIEKDEELCEHLRALNLGKAYELFESKYAEKINKARKVAILEAKLTSRLMDGGDINDVMPFIQTEVDGGNTEIVLEAVHKLLDDAAETQKMIRNVIGQGNDILKILSHYCRDEGDEGDDGSAEPSKNEPTAD